MNELAQVAQHSSLFSLSLSDEIIEQQQALKRHARRLNIISVNTPFFKDAEFDVLISFNEFSRFVDIDKCQVKVPVPSANTKKRTRYVSKIPIY